MVKQFELLESKVKDPYIREALRRIRLVLQDIDVRTITNSTSTTVTNNVRYDKIEAVADAGLVSSKTINLIDTPLTNSELLFLNGMLQNTDCYSISGSDIILDPGFDLQVGDEITIQYTY